MKIVIVNDMLWGGGRERRIVQLLSGLTKAGFNDVHLILLDDKVDYPEVLDIGINVVVIKRHGKKDLGVFMKLKRLLEDIKPDVVNSWSYLSTVYAALVCKWLRIPCVSSFISDCNAPKVVSLEYVAKHIAFLFCEKIVSNTLRGHDTYRTPLSKRVTIYNGFDESRRLKVREKASIMAEFGRPETSLVVSMVARFEKEKDFATFILACRLLRMRRQDFTVFCVGKGALTSQVVDDLASEDHAYIKFPGFRNDVESFIAASDVGVLCTNASNHQEGISNSLLEFMAFGKPVIGTAGGGTSELIRNEVNGFVVSPCSIEGVAEKIELLLSDRARYVEMSRNAAATVAAKFSLQHMTTEFIDLYGSVCFGHR